MPDISHYYGQDIRSGPTGDLLPVSATIKGQQRVIRRLMTNPGDYIWHPTYGAGLPQFVGRPATTDRIRGVIFDQIKLEDAVAQTPAPQVTVTFYPDGTFYVSISYTDALTGTQQLLAFDVPN